MSMSVVSADKLVSRRQLLKWIAISGSVLLEAACSAQPPAAPTSAPAKPTTVPAAASTAAPPAGAAATQAPAAAAKPAVPAAAPTQAPAVQSTSAPSASGAGTPRQGGTLIVARPGEGDSLDPAVSTSGFTSEVMTHTADNLVRFKAVTPADLMNGARLGEVEPGLAESWKISDDGLTVTFNLRKGVKFHDGTPVDADAIVLNIDRQLNQDNPYYFKGKMANASSTYGALASYRTVDPATVELKLKARFAPLLNNLAASTASIMSPAALKQYGQDIAKHPLGSGAFKFVEWQVQDHITVERNPDWWDGPPYLDKIIYRVVPETSVEIAKLQAGEVDLIDSVGPDDVSTIRGDANLTLFQTPGGLNAIHINCEKPQFNDVRVRQALNLAINKEELNQQLYSGLGTVANSPLPPIVPEYDPSLKAYPYDPAKAKQLLSDAGFANGFEARMIAYSIALQFNPIGGPKLAEAIQQYLSKVGVKVNIETLELGAWRSKKLAGDFDLCVGGWLGLNGDADGYFYPQYHSDTIGTNNPVRLHDPKLDQMIVDGQREYDHDKRKAIYAELQKYIMDIAPMIYLNVPSYLMAGKKSLVDVRVAGQVYLRALHKTWKQA